MLAIPFKFDKSVSCKRSTRARTQNYLNNYSNQLLSCKRSQLTIFIIVAILVVAIVALFFAFPKLRTAVGIEKLETPENFIQTCLQDAIKENVEIISSQGGSLEPSLSVLYNDEKIQYLCYTPQKYQACVVQVPFLEKHIEDEIKNSIKEDVDFCFNSLKENYDDRGYIASLKPGEIIVELLPQKIVTTINTEFVFSKDGTTQRRETFRVVLNNNLYELVAIAQSIMNSEISFGGGVEQFYMELYTDIKIELLRPFTEDTTIYILTDRNTQDKFKFAFQSWDLG